MMIGFNLEGWCGGLVMTDLLRNFVKFSVLEIFEGFRGFRWG